MGVEGMVMNLIDIIRACILFAKKKCSMDNNRCPGDDLIMF